MIWPFKKRDLVQDANDLRRQNVKAAEVARIKATERVNRLLDGMLREREDDAITK